MRFRHELLMAATAAAAVMATFGGLTASSAAVATDAGSRTARVQDVHPVCLLGNWVSTDIETHLRSVVAGAAIQIDSVTGHEYLSFSFQNSGHVDERLDAVTVNATVGRGDTLVETLNGGIDANFTESDDGTLRFTDVLPILSLFVTVNGQEFLTGADPSGFGLLSGRATATYDCSDEQLAITPNIAGVASAPFIFARIH